MAPKEPRAGLKSSSLIRAKSTSSRLPARPFVASMWSSKATTWVVARPLEVGRWKLKCDMWVWKSSLFGSIFALRNGVVSLLAVGCSLTFALLSSVPWPPLWHVSLPTSNTVVTLGQSHAPRRDRLSPYPSHLLSVCYCAAYLPSIGWPKNTCSCVS